ADEGKKRADIKRQRTIKQEKRHSVPPTKILGPVNRKVTCLEASRHLHNASHVRVIMESEKCLLQERKARQQKNNTSEQEYIAVFENVHISLFWENPIELQTR